MAGVRACLTLLAVALVCAATVQGSEYRPHMVGAPETIRDGDNDEGLQQALRFAMEEYNKASNDMYSSRVVRIISAKRQVVAGIKYIMEVEIARTTCEKPAADLQDCAFPDSPQLAKHTVCKFVVYTVPWLKKTELLKRECQ
ncbi:cystatin-like [Dryobates pubescens]|uniref:cystatin-like n=1 Tax=Dryobates pubescens TaxID=118200 RepID=UPI0023B89D84|nr:cystatin-like [Dryobates pubescens]